MILFSPITANHIATDRSKGIETIYDGASAFTMLPSFDTNPGIMNNVNIQKTAVKKSVRYLFFLLSNIGATRNKASANIINMIITKG